jgi:hypothetical protein
MTKIMAKIAFGSGGDPDLAAADLVRAGYKVNRLPDEYRLRLQDELDDHLEAIIEGLVPRPGQGIGPSDGHQGSHQAIQLRSSGRG